MACQGCGKEASQQELNLSGAGQWLCRSCLAQYEVQLATRRQHAAQVYRRCSCGATLGPRDEMNVPLHFEDLGGRRSVNLEYAFRRTVYDCGCGQCFTLLHPVLVVVPGLVGLICLVLAPAADKLATCLVAGGLFAVLAAPQLYFRQRFPAVR